ncbi:MAG: hypothetical protein QOG52_1280, partial [Frankiaceae bacterium]|nr:hypothetical protein [Frankiaceae bacterium]
KRRVYAARVTGDVDGADLSGVGGTPTFFINGRRHHGAFDLKSLSAAVVTAGARAAIAPAASSNSEPPNNTSPEPR